MIAIGESAGISLGNAAVDWRLHDTCYAATHVHLVLSFGATIAIFSGKANTMEKILWALRHYYVHYFFHILIYNCLLLIYNFPVHFLGSDVVADNNPILSSCFSVRELYLTSIG